MKRKFIISKYVNRNKKAVVEINFDEIEKIFSASGEIWHERGHDIISGGQNLDELMEMYPDHEILKRIYLVWKNWHLNHMHAGSPAQEKYLKDNKMDSSYDYYNQALKRLKEVGLEPDPSYIVDEKPYHFGSDWLKRDLPPEIIKEIEDLMEIDCPTIEG
jgi:hypothetical protein